MKFEDQMKRLEEIVLLLEDENTGLEQSIAYFKEGNKIIKFCENKIEQAYKEIALENGEN